MTTKFGWCIDSIHDKCTVWFRWESGTTECDCACHEGKEKPALKEVFVEAPRRPSRAKAASVARAPRGNEKSAKT